MEVKMIDIKPGMIYTGIGSRKTPGDIMSIMHDVASYLESRGAILRSGGANGADSAFESGIYDASMMEIYLPWPGFNGRSGEEFICTYIECHVDIAKASHPAWGYMSRGPRALHTRNVAQVLGSDCNTPSDFVICWTENGSVSGGTATAIKVAYANRIPVYNIYHEEPRAAVVDMMSTGSLDESWVTI
jgi:hypothetical protein